MIRLINAYDIDYASYIRNENYTVRECLQAEKIIKQQPTVDAEPVRHAYWIRQGIYRGNDTSGFIEWVYRCSDCGNEALMNNMCLIVLTDYCPHCGAKMDAERKEE